MKPALLKQPNNEKLLKSKKSERKGAKFMLQNLMPLIRMRIADLIQQAAVNEPTAVQFFWAMGCRSFQDFKLPLAQHLASCPSDGNIAVTDAKSLKEHICKAFDSTAEMLLKVRDRPILEN